MIIRHVSTPSIHGQRDQQKPSGLDLRNPFIGGAAAAALYLITNHGLHVLDALPYLRVVLMMGMHRTLLFREGGPQTQAVSRSRAQVGFGDGPRRTVPVMTWATGPTRAERGFGTCSRGHTQVYVSDARYRCRRRPG